jgi:hypothetical protein
MLAHSYLKPSHAKLPRVAPDTASPTPPEHKVPASAIPRISIDEAHRAFMRERFLISDYINSFD